MQYQDGRLTVQLDHVPLDQVVERLEQETELRFYGELLDWREVTKHFDGVPLPEALDRLLGRQNFILRYDAAGRPESVELGGLPQAPQAPKGRTTRPPANVLQLLGAAPPVVVTPSLRAALRTNTASLTQLFLFTLHQTDAGIRAEALRAFVTAVQGNSTLRNALSRADPKTIVPLLRSLPAEQADARLLDLSQGSSDPVLRAFFLRARMQAQRDRVARPGSKSG